MLGTYLGVGRSIPSGRAGQSLCCYWSLVIDGERPAAAEDLQRCAYSEITIELGTCYAPRLPKSCCGIHPPLGVNAVNFLRRNPYLATVARGVGSAGGCSVLRSGKPQAKLTSRRDAWPHDGRRIDKGGHVWIRRDRAVEFSGENRRATCGGEGLALAVRGRLLTLRDDAEGVTWVVSDGERIRRLRLPAVVRALRNSRIQSWKTI